MLHYSLCCDHGSVVHRCGYRCKRKTESHINEYHRLCSLFYAGGVQLKSIVTVVVFECHAFGDVAVKRQGFLIPSLFGC